MSRTRDRRRQPSSFRCRNCGLDVGTSAPGTAHRNHCPSCLWSLHVDNVPGDRDAGCDAAMEPIGVTARRNGEWVLVHRCRACRTVHLNRIAGDDNALALVQLAVRPLATAPFPLDRLNQL